MQASFRGRDIVARLGGDEFVVMLADVTFDEAIAALSCTQRSRGAGARRSSRRHSNVTCTSSALARPSLVCAA